MLIPRAIGRRVLLLVLVAVVVGACSPGGSVAPSTAGSAGASPAGSTTTGAGATSGPCPTAAGASIAPGWQSASGNPTVYPTLISSQQVCGRDRFLFGFIDKQNRSAAEPERTASVGFYNLGRNADTAIVTVTARFQWLLEDVTGIYVADVTYPEAGEWGAEFVTSVDGGTPEVIRARFQVQPDGMAPGIGDRAPSTKTPTLDDVDGDPAKLSSDTEPDPQLYEVSIDTALAEGRPFVVAFATPAFCRSQTCGPMLDVVKAVAKNTSGVTFINVEPYILEFKDGRLQPVLSANNQLQPAPATLAFGIPSEPWVFVVDGDGIVRGSFEATVTADELRTAIAAATST
ncbi:MAG: hypothetical protein FJ038_08275 [Chloroflexi bacterium]|nr:hypothetical protein [Chloroflexota bacterium]